MFQTVERTYHTLRVNSKQANHFSSLTF